ncbi:MAG: outer membrane beta-barrel protein [Bdellovibrionaceae bacterium]|nr:outer membrane beta-barrel protein [Pseudobdellovibrionaceae bacterium]
MKSLLTLFATIFLASNVFALKKAGGGRALKGGTFSIGLGIGMGSFEQDGLNESIRNAKSISGATTGEMNSAVEYMGFATYRFANNIVALQIRPTFFSQTSKGNGTGGAFDYSLDGYSVFPLIRFIPLSNDIIDFYIQAGLGYGKLDGSITNGARKVSFGGSSFGTQVGIGAEFCFWPEHCFGLEGNYRYLPIERNKVLSASGALPDGIGQASPNHELENNSGDDVGTKLSGVSGVVTYSFNF